MKLTTKLLVPQFATIYKMAQIFFRKLPNLYLLILALAVIIFVAHTKQFKETKMSMYLQDVSAGPNAPVIPVTGIAGKQWTFTQFGTVFVTDDPITKTPDSNSAPVGRLQGIYLTSGLNGLNSHVSVSIVFTNKVYNGSTLELQGNSKQFEWR